MLKSLRPSHRGGKCDGFIGGIRQRLWGTLAERVAPRQLIVMTTLLAAAAGALLMQVNNLALAFLFAGLFGLNARGAGVLIQILIARYFGRSALGAISSVHDPFHKGGLGLGAPPAGVAFDYFGNYRVIFLIFLLSFLISTALIFLARWPRAREP